MKTRTRLQRMTPEERAQPVIINGSRRQRIASGSGTQVGDVNRLVKQFGEMQKMMKKMGMGGPGGGRPGKGKKGKKGRTGSAPKGRGLPPGLLDPNAVGGMDIPGLPGMPNMPGLPGVPNR